MMNVVLIVTMALGTGRTGRTLEERAGRYEMNGKKVYAKEILKNPDKYFTEEVLQKLDEVQRRVLIWFSMMFFLDHTVKN